MRIEALLCLADTVTAHALRWGARHRWHLLVGVPAPGAGDGRSRRVSSGRRHWASVRRTPAVDARAARGRPPSSHMCWIAWRSTRSLWRLFAGATAAPADAFTCRGAMLRVWRSSDGGLPAVGQANLGNVLPAGDADRAIWQAQTVRWRRGGLSRGRLAGAMSARRRQRDGECRCRPLLLPGCRRSSGKLDGPPRSVLSAGMTVESAALAALTRSRANPLLAVIYDSESHADTGGWHACCVTP